MARPGPVGGRRWQTAARAGLSHREAGSQGGAARCWSPPRSPLTPAEAAMRGHMGEATPAALAVEYGVCLSTVRRWGAAFEEEG